jgi:uncharacterized protein (TIGR03546 family)
LAILLKQVFSFIKLLNSETGTNQIAAGFACGIILGFSPLISLQTALVFVLIFFLRIQVGAALLSAPVFAAVAWLLDPLFDGLGSLVLESEALKPLFTSLYHMPIVPFTRFNNSVVMGSGILAILLAPFVFALSKVLVTKYRQKILARFQNALWWKTLKATPLVQAYLKWEALHG